jgi:hypothetical protein
VLIYFLGAPMSLYFGERNASVNTSVLRSVKVRKCDGKNDGSNVSECPAEGTTKPRTV